MGYWDKREKKEREEREKMAREDSVETLEALEKECAEEMDSVSKSFRERMKKENNRFRDMCDSEYWFCVCFTRREQKEEFLRKIGINPDSKYIDGKEMARAYKKSITAPDLEFARIKKPEKEYAALARDYQESKS